METITLKERETFKIYLNKADGTPKTDDKGKQLYLDIDLEDIELPLRYNKCDFLIRKAYQDLKWDFITIDKRQDNKGKMLLSKNEEDKMKAIKQYYKATEEAIEMFLGKDSVSKIFGDKRYLEMWDDLAEYLQPILPKLSVNFENIENKIKNKYKTEESNVLKNE